jgi:ubiquinol-cytochrome c reductase cytochrome c subunit
MRRWAAALVAFTCAVLALVTWAAPRGRAQGDQGPLVRAGRADYLEACSTCHGDDARGIRGKGPALVGAGAAAADFYLSTGRMPLAHPSDEPMRAPPAYGPAPRRALVAYLASLGGPPVPRVDAAAGSLSEGKRLFTSHCSGCHQVVAEGGIVAPDGVAPPLQEADARQIVEAMRVGPYTMPPFSDREITDAQANSLARFVLSTRDPVDRGGWGIGHLGPVPEGMVAWLLAGAALLVVLRLLGKRSA